MIRDPEFAKKVHFIVVEFGNKAYQPILDRYERGEDVTPAELRHVFSDTLGLGIGGTSERPVNTDFLAAIRDVNRKLPREKQIRVLAGDPPVGSDERRDDSPVSILRHEVLDQGGKALVIYGSGHFMRYSGIPGLLQHTNPGRVSSCT